VALIQIEKTGLAHQISWFSGFVIATWHFTNFAVKSGN